MDEVATHTDSQQLRAKLARALSEFVAALVEADGGQLYIVDVTLDDVHLHLTGTCAGCPGLTMTRERLLFPVLRATVPKATVKITTGWRAPDGATQVHPSSS